MGWQADMQAAMGIAVTSRGARSAVRDISNISTTGNGLLSTPHSFDHCSRKNLFFSERIWFVVPEKICYAEFNLHDLSWPDGQRDHHTNRIVIIAPFPQGETHVFFVYEREILRNRR